MHRFVGLPEDNKGKVEKTYLFKKSIKKRSDGTEVATFKKVKQVLWGDFLTVDNTQDQDGWLRIVWGPNSNKPETLYIPEDHTVERRPLEIIFLDVGQGDGAVLVTPETNKNEKIILIDAGEGDHMARFINGRFKAYRNGFDFHAAIITHPDADHYQGFREIFSSEKIGFDKIYHNGLMELPVSGKFQKLGGTTRSAALKTTFVNELVETDKQARKLYKDKVGKDDYWFPNLMRAAVANPNIGDIEMLSTEHGTRKNNRCYVPRFAPSSSREYDIEILGPVPEKDDNGDTKLRKIGSYGETKNGHSVLLRLSYGKFNILFGGDLNDKAEKYLLKHYSGSASWPKHGTPKYKAMIEKAAERFRSDVMKVCHHGSEKVTDAFLETVNPAAFVISSGDQEGHVHPRPDLLGRLGRFGRGVSPVILSTELQRSTRENEDRHQVERLKKRIDNLYKRPEEPLREAIKDAIEELAKTNVDVYGAIYVKTDGDRLIAAFKKEELSETDKWFFFTYRIDEDGVLTAES